ncbi:MAG TPA: hypothetical protein VIC34_09720 [Croceibacterium sp.]|jgi:hypothetical protein
MYVIVVDIVAVLLVAGGIALLAKRSGAGGSDAGTYARRIGGTMIAAFGLALGLMVTVFHFAGG